MSEPQEQQPAPTLQQLAAEVARLRERVEDLDRTSFGQSAIVH